ncbi:MAG TPA: DUF748 domain-containing protein [Flavobacteriales bacterium]|nr:DUF748 domain-containing protein [Flavobacteriales bacterium]
MGNEKPKKKWSRRRKILIGIVVLLVGFRIALPYIVLRYVNNKLAGLSEYYGHVEDIDIHLYRGAYVIKDIEIVKLNKQKKVDPRDSMPFFSCPEIDLSIEWGAIFKGKIVGEIYVEEPKLNFVKGRHEGENVKQDTADLRQLIDDLTPVTINHFEINQGQIHYIDPNTQPRLDIAMTHVEVVALNLTNVKKKKDKLPATVKATGQAYKGNFNMNIRLDALARVPTFDLNGGFKNISMPMLNDMWRAYGNFDVSKGNFGFYTEFAAKNGEFGGYVKPLISDLDVVQWKKEEGNIGQILWETLVGTTAEIVQNQRTEILATKVPISGRFDRPNINTWRAVSYLFRNAFVAALKPSIDNSININRLEENTKKTLLEKVFGNRNKKSGDREKRKSERKQVKN